jgi:hypothetical protein
MIPQQRRVAVLGGTRIPFCKRDTAYADLGNLGLSVKVLGALVEKFGLQGVELGEVAFGAVMKHPADWNLAREAAQSSGLAMTTPGTAGFSSRNEKPRVAALNFSPAVRALLRSSRRCCRRCE